MKKPPLYDYRHLRPNTLLTPQYRHLLLLIFWPVFSMIFAFLERRNIGGTFLVMYTPLDSHIPFQELFLLPYLYWFIFLAGTLLYLLLYDVENFRRMMYYVILTYGTTVIIYLIFPTMQKLRPHTFARDNFLTDIMAWYYIIDTNTNVCPSLHVIGSVAAMCAGLRCPHFRSAGWRIYFVVVAVLISFSTVFVKQHSILDMFYAIPICLAADWLIYRRPVRRKRAVTAA